MRNEVLNRRTFMSVLAAATLPSVGMAQAPTPPSRVYSRGARIPPNLTNRIRAQNEAAALSNSILQSDQTFMGALNRANPRILSADPALPAQFDWRNSQRVTQPREQGACGSCWVFAATAAYESAFLIANNRPAFDVNDRETVNVSEQQALDCGFVEYDCVIGGWHEAVLLYLWERGLVGEGTYRYRETKGLCTSNIRRSYYVLLWGYVSDITAPDFSPLPSDLALKQAIHRYGPVASSVATKDWDYYRKLDWNGNPNPQWLVDYPNGVFKGEPTSTLNVSDIDHEVTIIGWDDGLGVWIIKNSWGTDWGDEGFMKLSYQSNYIGYGASWVTVSPDGSVSEALATRLRNVNSRNALRSFYPQINQLR